MKLPLLALSFIVVGLIFTGCNKAPKTETEKTSYALGVQFAESLKKNSIAVDEKMVSAAVRDVVKGKNLQMTNEQIQETLFEMTKKNDQTLQQEGQMQLEAGKKFYDEFVKKHSAKTTPKGVAYRVLKAGSGPVAGNEQIARIHYEGRLIDGKIFDSSKLRGKVAEFPVNAVIPGWREALTRMNVGSHWEIVVPASQAYGETGNQLIPRNATLIFDIELLGVK